MAELTDAHPGAIVVEQTFRCLLQDGCWQGRRSSGKIVNIGSFGHCNDGDDPEVSGGRIEVSLLIRQSTDEDKCLTRCEYDVRLLRKVRSE